MMKTSELKYKVLSFATGLLILFILVFFMSRMLPGELLLSQSGENKKVRADAAKQQLQKEAVFKNLGYHLPVFYFTLESLAVPDSFSRMADQRFSKTLCYAAYQTGSPVASYDLCNYIRGKYGLVSPFKMKNAEWINKLELKISDSLLFADERVSRPVLELNDASFGNVWKRYIPVVRFSSDNQFHRWLFGKPGESGSGLISGDLGKSIVRGQYVLTMIKFPLLFSVSFSLLVCLFSIPVGLWLGALLAASVNRSFVRFLMNVFLFYYNMPIFVAAIGAVFLFANPHMLNILPSSGPLLDTTGSVWNWFDSFFSQWNYLVLPLLVFSASSVFYIAQLTCEVLWAEFEKPYTLTLLSKGFERSYIIRHQLLRNAKIPVYVTMISVFPALVSGSLLLDYFFSLNGMGSIIVQAHASKDILLITGAFLVSGVVSMLTFFLSDYLVSVIDPRGKKVQLNKSGE